MTSHMSHPEMLELAEAFEIHDDEGSGRIPLTKLDDVLQ
eukprot:gene15214-4546_t